MTEFDKAYVAGFFDGEGYISIEKKQLNLRVGIANTNKDIMEWIHINFGGQMQKVNAEKYKHKPCYLWRASSKQAENFLKYIYPFLKVKKLRAEIAFKLRETFNYENFNNQKISPGIIQQRLDFRKQMLVLNL